MLNDYSFLTKSQSAPKATSGIDYSFLTRTTTPKETPKTPENIVKASDYKKVRLPLSLGGGEYITNDRGDLYLTPRNQETLGGTLPGMERDHIVPVSLGGTSNIQNLQYLESKPSFWQRIGGIFGKETSVQKSPNRQEGKLKVEQKAISGFKSGDLSIGEARLMVAMENMRIQGIIPEKNKETTWGNLGYGVKKALGDVFVKAPVGLAKEMASNIVGSLDFLHRTGLQVVSGVGTFVSPTVVSISKLLGDDQLKNISHDQIWADAIKEGADRMLDIGRPDEFFRAKINNDTYVPMMLFNDEIKALAKSSNEKMEQGDVRGSFADAGKIGAIKFMTDWANPFYAFAIKGVRFDPTKARGKVLWQGTFKQPVNQIGKAKEVQGVLRLETKPQKIVEVIKGRVKKLKEPDIRIWMKTTKDGKISVDVRNVGGDILNKDLLKVVGETTT
ncbi:HNH endonuclease, partial [Candidatus Falkowbacteria bacterium]|nr:HNH endonuclease [Candidatus Falkowbacteria bacterium]